MSTATDSSTDKTGTALEPDAGGGGGGGWCRNGGRSSRGRPNLSRHSLLCDNTDDKTVTEKKYCENKVRKHVLTSKYKRNNKEAAPEQKRATSSVA